MHSPAGARPAMRRSPRARGGAGTWAPPLRPASTQMADSTSAVLETASLPTSADIERAKDFTREPFLHEGEQLEDVLAPGTARRRALDAALAELAEGAENPSVQWRRE